MWEPLPATQIECVKKIEQIDPKEPSHFPNFDQPNSDIDDGVVDVYEPRRCCDEYESLC